MVIPIMLFRSVLHDQCDQIGLFLIDFGNKSSLTKEAQVLGHYLD